MKIFNIFYLRLLYIYHFLNDYDGLKLLFYQNFMLYIVILYYIHISLNLYGFITLSLVSILDININVR